jgi:hypothetical protein
MGRGFLDGRSNAYVETGNGLLLQTKITARSFYTATNFIAITCLLYVAKFKHLSATCSAPPCRWIDMPPEVELHMTQSHYSAHPIIQYILLAFAC